MNKPDIDALDVLLVVFGENKVVIPYGILDVAENLAGFFQQFISEGETFFSVFLNILIIYCQRAKVRKFPADVGEFILVMFFEEAIPVTDTVSNFCFRFWLFLFSHV